MDFVPHLIWAVAVVIAVRLVMGRRTDEWKLRQLEDKVSAHNLPILANHNELEAVKNVVTRMQGRLEKVEGTAAPRKVNF